MWLGVLFVVLALKAFQDNSKNKYLKIFIYLFLSINCYQSIILLYIPALILITAIDNKESIKKLIKPITYNILIVIANIIIGYVIVKVIRYYNSFEPYQQLYITFNLKNLLNNMITILNYNSIFPNGTIFIINIMIIIYLVHECYYKRVEKKQIFIAESIIIISFIEVLSYIVLTNYYVVDRIIYAYTASIALVLIYLIKTINNKVLFVGLALVLLFLQIFSCIKISIHSRETRETDYIYGEKVHKLIDKYEKENNLKVNKIVYCHDDDNEISYKGYKKSNEETCRGFYGKWVLQNIFNYFNEEHDFETIYDQDIYKKKFKSKNWDDFSEEQFIFEGDTLYYCVY